jgi:hypothetical protein
MGLYTKTPDSPEEAVTFECVRINRRVEGSTRKEFLGEKQHHQRIPPRCVVQVED